MLVDFLELNDSIEGVDESEVMCDHQQSLFVLFRTGMHQLKGLLLIHGVEISRGLIGQK